ncbi:type VI secretion system baseplate subunit TssE [Candidatus Marithrix sp. Canyon 246]|uniref:type VI secretion system baseplate subunit TssE n=1 Tax=Candidatus Marithrix sp. Canyon 246 TaxID=1827136 RepID=UPI00084A0A8C|nr:type VI secretion system baseplate subunit TssE [Candidatus Marithrix sp. Canyon 246]
MERSLLERIDHPEVESIRQLTLDTDELSRSILRNLQNMFNTRQGSVLTVADYGSPDFNDLVDQFPDAIMEIRKSILYNVKQYEPRLKNIRVRHIADEENPLDLKFEISGQLNLGKSRTSVAFTTIMGDSGRIKIRG